MIRGRPFRGVNRPVLYQREDTSLPIGALSASNLGSHGESVFATRKSYAPWELQKLLRQQQYRDYWTPFSSYTEFETFPRELVLGQNVAEQVEAVAMTAGGVLIALRGTATTYVASSRDGGKTWTRATGATVTGGFSARAAVIVPATAGLYIVGAGSNPVGYLVSAPNYNTVISQGSHGAGGNIVNAIAAGPNRILAANAAANANQNLRTSTDGGVTFAAVADSSIAATINSIAWTGTHFVYAGASAAAIYRVNEDLTGLTLLAPALSNQNSICSRGNGDILVTNATNSRYSTDNGATWTDGTIGGTAVNAGLAGMHSVVVIDNVFVHLVNNRVSFDGVNWIAAENLSAGITGTAYVGISGNRRAVLAGTRLTEDAAVNNIALRRITAASTLANRIAFSAGATYPGRSFFARVR